MLQNCAFLLFPSKYFFTNFYYADPVVLGSEICMYNWATLYQWSVYKVVDILLVNIKMLKTFNKLNRLSNKVVLIRLIHS